MQLTFVINSTPVKIIKKWKAVSFATLAYCVTGRHSSTLSSAKDILFKLPIVLRLGKQIFYAHTVFDNEYRVTYYS